MSPLAPVPALEARSARGAAVARAFVVDAKAALRAGRVIAAAFAAGGADGALRALAPDVAAETSGALRGALSYLSDERPSRALEEVERALAALDRLLRRPVAGA